MADDTKTAESGAASQPSPDTPDRADEPGRSSDRDAIDPELVALPRPPRGRIGPVLATSVIVFCVYIMSRLYGDLQFSREPREPRVFDSAAELLERAEVEAFVRVRAVPDRTFAVKVAHSQADEGRRLAPVQGSNGKLWIMIGGNVWTAGIKYEEIYTGRLRALSDVPFADDLRAHVAAREPGPRFVTPDKARAALDSEAATLADPAGDVFAVSADTPVQIYETIADQARVQVFATDRHPLERDWTAALAAIGLVSAEIKPARGQNDSWIYLVNVPGGANAARDRLHAAKLFSARTDPVRRVYQATWGQLSSQGDSLVAGNQRVPWSNITWVSADVRRTLPADARVLLTQELPESYWYVLPVFVLLGLFALVFAWALVRSLGRGPEAESDAPGASGATG